MRLTIRYESGMRVEAILLAASSERMRVAIGGQRDTIELHRLESSWHTESGAEIEIEAMIPLPEMNVSDFCAAVHPLTLTAGGGSMFAQ
jgi:hypothetical protein